ATRRDNRMHPRIEHPQQNLDHFKATTRVALREHVRALKHHRAYDSLGKRLSDPARMRTDQVDLKLTKFFSRDRDIGKRTKAGVDAVDDFATRDDVFNKAAGPLYAGSRSGGK